MIKNIVLIFVLFFCSIVRASSQSEIDYHTFDPFRDKLVDIRDNPQEPLKPNQNPIPKIIHQFWIGDSPLPDIYKFAIDSCKNIEGFEHKLWTNKEIDSLLDDSEEYRVTYNKIPYFAGKKNYLSYLALKKYGGVTIDASIMCRKSPLALHENYSSYFMYTYCEANQYHVCLFNAGIVAATKNDLIINNIIKNFPHFIDHYKDYNQKYTDPSFTDRDLFHGWINQVLINEAVYNFVSSTTFRGSYFLSKEDIFRHKFKPKDPIFVNLDYLPTAFAIKAMNKQAPIDTFLNIIREKYAQ